MCDDPFFISAAILLVLLLLFRIQWKINGFWKLGLVNTNNSDNGKRQTLNDAAAAVAVEWWKQHKRINFSFILSFRYHSLVFTRASARLLINVHKKNSFLLVFFLCARLYDVYLLHSHASEKLPNPYTDDGRKKMEHIAAVRGQITNNNW